MIDIVIPYQKSNTQELKFALRSIDRFVKFKDVYIIGDRTDFKVNHIPFNDVKNRKNYSLYLKCIEACKYTDRFIYWHDDHFALKEINELPNYYNHSLQREADRLGKGMYYRYVNNTIKVLNDPEAKNFDIHVPVIMERERLLSMNYDWSNELILKSLYCYGLDGEFMSDMKLNFHYPYETLKNILQFRTFFSTGEHGISKYLIKYLNEIFPNKSIFESI